MDFFNLTGSNIFVVLGTIIIAIVLIIIIIIAFKEKKKITEVTLKNMDYKVYPILTFDTSRTVQLTDQIFQTPFGPVSVIKTTNDDDTTSAVIIQVKDGPRNFSMSNKGNALILSVTNRTKNPLIISGGTVIATLKPNDKSSALVSEPLLGGIRPVTVLANETNETELVVVGGEVPDNTMFSVTLSNAA